MGAARVFIREPWAGLIVAGLKTIETAAHGLPDRYAGQWLDVQTERREIVGRVIFSRSYRYETAAAFDRDRARHMVEPGSRFYFGSRARSYAWEISAAEAYPEPIPSPPMPGQFRFD